MGLFGGAKKPKLPPMPSLGPLGEEFRDIVYPRVESALAGQGFDPRLRGTNLASTMMSLDRRWREMKADLPGETRRMAPAGDSKVRDFRAGQLDRDYYRTRHQLQSDAEDIPIRERSAAIGQGLDLVAGERQIGATIASQYTQWLSGEAGAPTFGSQLAGGLGGAAGMYLGSLGSRQPMNQVPAQRYGELMSNPRVPTDNFFSRTAGSTGMVPQY